MPKTQAKYKSVRASQVPIYVYLDRAVADAVRKSRGDVSLSAWIRSAVAEKLDREARK